MDRPLCPICKRKISFLTFLKAVTPWHLRCPSCKSKLKVGKYPIRAFILALILGGILTLVRDVYTIPFIYFILILFLIGIVLEYVYYVLAGVLKFDIKEVKTSP